MRTKIRLASKNTCTACLACLDSCPEKAIHACVRPDGHLYPEIDSGVCVKCGRCMEVCPVVSGYDYQDIARRSEPYAVWANDDELRMQSASGGLFAALAVYVLSQGGVVAGASMEGTEVRHILISGVHELYKIQNSKYQQVVSSGIYKAVKEALRQGKTVLFGGTSCQIAGLSCFLGENKFSGHLYTADMICSGFPSLLALESFLKHEAGPVQTIIYRDKKEGCEKGHRLSVIFKKEAETERVYAGDLVYAAFGTHYTHRSCCLNCRFAVARRKADITMGDFWGDTDFPEQHYKGLSLAIVHTDRGRDLLKRAELTVHSSAWEKVLKVNFRLVYGKFSFLKFHPARWFYPWLFTHCSYGLLLKIYRGAGSYSRGWYPYLVFCKMIGLLDKLQRGRGVLKFLKRMKYYED